MNTTTLIALAQAAGSGPKPSTIITGLLAALAVIAVGSVIVTWLLSKILQIDDASFGRALVATFFKNVAWIPAFLMLTTMGLDPKLALLFGVTVLPYVIFRVVFEPLPWQNIVLILGVAALEVIMGFVLTVVGFASFHVLLR